MGAENCHIACELLLAILLPPLGVFFRTGCCSCEFLVCILLTVLGYIPGILYAIYVIVVARKNDESSRAVSTEGPYSAIP